MLDDAPTERMVAHLDAMLARLATGEPLQYVLGQWCFRHIELAIDRRVLIPRPETELVAGVAIEQGPHVRPAAHGRRPRHGVRGDRAVAGVRTAARRHHRVDHRRQRRRTRRRPGQPRRPRAGGPQRAGRRRARGSTRCRPTLRFDVIVSNPPYVEIGSPDVDASVTDWEPADGAVRRRRTGSTTSGCSSPARPRHLRRRWLARAGDRVDAGCRGGGAPARAAASSTSRSARTSPATTASPSAADRLSRPPAYAADSGRRWPVPNLRRWI